MINGRGFPVPNMANFSGPVNGVPEYTGDRGVRTEWPSRKMSFRRLVKKETVKADLIDLTDDETMSRDNPGLAATTRNNLITREGDKWTYPTILDESGANVVIQNIVTGKLREKPYANPSENPGYRVTCREGCDQPYVVRTQQFATVMTMKQVHGDAVLTDLPSGLPGVKLQGDEVKVIPPCELGKNSFFKPERREVLPIHAAPIASMSTAIDAVTNAEVVEWPGNQGLTFHYPRCVKTEKNRDGVLFPPQNRDARLNPVFWENTDILQDGEFLWSVDDKHTKCETLPRPMWFGLDLWAGGVIDIDHKQNLHALPGFIVLTDDQAKARRPFACITKRQCQWIDMLERLLMRQQELRSGDDRDKTHRPGELGPLTIYSLDRAIRPETLENMCEEATRWRNVVVPKADLINMVNSAVYATTCAAKGREVCRARNELKKHNSELEQCYEEMFGQAEAALDARFRAACECYRRARTVCLKTVTQDQRLIPNQARFYVPEEEVSRSLVELSMIDTLTLGRAEMQYYKGRNQRFSLVSDFRYESNLAANPSAIMGLPMPAVDLAFMWGMLSGILQASFIHLDVVMMAGLKPNMDTAKPGDCAEWNPNQAAYMMGLARDEFEQAARDKVGPRVALLMANHTPVGEHWTPPEYIAPRIEYAERALMVQHPTCVAWRYELPDTWDGTAVHSKIVGRADPFDEVHKLQPNNSREICEKKSRGEDYVDLFAAVNVESRRREIWNPEAEDHWATRADQIDEEQRPSILLGEAWVRLKSKLTQTFDEKLIKKVNQYLAVKPARPVTKGMWEEVSLEITDASAWWESSQDGEPRMAISTPMRGHAVMTGEPSRTDEPMDDTPLVPRGSYTNNGEPLPPSTASSSHGSVEKVRRRKRNRAPPPPPPPEPAIDPNARRSPNRASSADESETEGDSTDSTVGDPDPDYYVSWDGLNPYEVRLLPKSDQLKRIPENTLWNVLQTRPTKEAWKSEAQERDPMVRSKRVDRVSPFCLHRLDTTERPIRTKAKVKAIVEQQHAMHGDGWETPAVVQMTERGRYENLSPEHHLFGVAQSICDRDAKLALGNAVELAMTAPVKASGLPDNRQPRAIQKEMLRRHNAQLEAMRGVTAWKHAPPKEGYLDYERRKVPWDKEYLFDNFMLLTNEEYAELQRAFRDQWAALKELKKTEQLCYIPLAGRSFNERAFEEWHKALRNLLIYTRLVQLGRGRLYDAAAKAKSITKSRSLEDAKTELESTNTTLGLLGPSKKVMIQFVEMDDWLTFEEDAPVVATGECDSQFRMTKLPLHTVQACDLEEPDVLINDRRGTALAGAMLLLGVPVYRSPKTVDLSKLHWYSAGFIFRALGEKREEGGQREAECVNVYRMKPIRRYLRMPQEVAEWARSVSVNIEEMWLEDGQYRRISNRADDEYMPTELHGTRPTEGGPKIPRYPANVLRKLTGKAHNPDMVGEYAKLNEDDEEYYCRGCNVQFRDGCKDKEYCLYRPENHPFGAIMLKTWCRPDDELILPEEEGRMQQKQDMYAERLKIAAETFLSPSNQGTLREVAQWSGVSEKLLIEELRKQKRLRSSDLDELPLETEKLEVLDRAMQYRPKRDPCGKCGSTSHNASTCKAKKEKVVAHYQAVVKELAKPAPHVKPGQGEPSTSAATSSANVDWRSSALAKMKEGKLTMDDVAPASSHLVNLVTAPPRGSMPPGGGRNPERRYKRERDSSVSSNFSQSSRGGRGRYSRGGLSWASSHPEEPRAKRVSNPSRSRSSGRGDPPGFSKSYAGSSSGEFKAPWDPPAWRKPGRVYDPVVDDNYVQAFHPNPKSIGKGWDYVADKRGGGEPRMRQRSLAIYPNRLGDFHNFKEVNVELSRAVYENLGFMPSGLRHCAQKGKRVPDDAKFTDRRAPLANEGLGSVGHDEVWNKWSRGERKRHDQFYKAGDYLSLKRDGWCLDCLCPGHFRSTCRRDAKQGRVECTHCGSGIHERSACPLLENNVGCDQCGSMNHGRLRCGLNEALSGDATCSVRYRLLRAYAKFLPRYHEFEEEHKAALASRPELVYTGQAERVSELVRVMRVLGVDEGYY